MMQKKRFLLAVSVALLDAGESTRALEIVKALRALAVGNFELDIVFFSHGGIFEQRIIDNGFPLVKIQPSINGAGFHKDFAPTKSDFIGDLQLNREMLSGELAALQEYSPDAVLYGFWPFSALARRLVTPTIAGICFLPIPLERNVYCTKLLRDVPDQLEILTFLPLTIRRLFMCLLPTVLKSKVPIMRQKNILLALQDYPLMKERVNDLFDIMKSDLTLVNDVPVFYSGLELPREFIVTGPVYALPQANEHLDDNIERLFVKVQQSKMKIFCTMGSSGRKEYLLEAIKAIAALPEQLFNAVILVPTAICDLDSAQALVQGKENIWLTDKFVPAKVVNALADIVVCHGGQGTLQTAMSCGTPVVGVAMQPEQQINLDNITSLKAGIRLPQVKWKSQNIRRAIFRVVDYDSYKKAAYCLKQQMSQYDGANRAASEILEFIKCYRTLPKE